MCAKRHPIVGHRGEPKLISYSARLTYSGVPSSAWPPCHEPPRELPIGPVVRPCCAAKGCPTDRVAGSAEPGFLCCSLSGKLRIDCATSEMTPSGEPRQARSCPEQVRTPPAYGQPASRSRDQKHKRPERIGALCKATAREHGVSTLSWTAPWLASDPSEVGQFARNGASACYPEGAQTDPTRRDSSICTMRKWMASVNNTRRSRPASPATA